jgi:hypothetical protein
VFVLIPMLTSQLSQPGANREGKSENFRGVEENRPGCAHLRAVADRQIQHGAVELKAGAAFREEIPAARPNNATCSAVDQT